MKNFDINYVLEKLRVMYTETEQKQVPDGLYNPSEYGLFKGYNVIASGRGGGKSTIFKLVTISAFYEFGVMSILIRASKTETTRSMCASYFNDLLNIVFPDGRNAIQHLTNDKYDTIYYYFTEHCYRLGRETDDPDDLKNEPPLCLITSYDKSSDMCSNISYPNLKIITCEEICDNRISPHAFMDFLHIISTLFRLDINTYVFLLGNISRGNPDLLIKLEVYDRMRTSETPFFVHKTKEGTMIHVTLFNALPKKDTARYMFNKQYFGFDIQGIDVLKGQAQPLELYRELPPDVEIIPTNYYINALDMWMQVYKTVSETWQTMYYIKQCLEPPHEHGTLTVTDNEMLAYTTPYTYYNCGNAIDGVPVFLKAYALNDICYETYMCKIALDCLIRTHN